MARRDLCNQRPLASDGVACGVFAAPCAEEPCSMWQPSPKRSGVDGPEDAPSGRPLQPFRYLQRLSIVIVGILSAFALQSWWTGHFAHVEEHANLAALRENFRENGARIDSVSL